MYIDRISDIPQYCIQELDNDDIYIILQGLKLAQERIKIHPTNDNVKYLKKLDSMIMSIVSEVK